MLKQDIRVYIAAPFFNEAQLEMVKSIEAILEENGVDYFSPRSEGVIRKMNAVEKASYMRKIYDSNISNMENCNVMIAVIDDYDTGTVFELGFFTFMKKHSFCGLRREHVRIITITGNNYELNVMLKFGTDCHLKGSHSLMKLFADVNVEDEISDGLMDIYDSKPEVKT